MKAGMGGIYIKRSIASSLDIQLDLIFTFVFQHFLQPENMPYVPKSLGDLLGA